MTNEVSPDGQINVTIANVVKWFEESERRLLRAPARVRVLHNHAQRIPETKTQSPDLFQSIIKGLGLSNYPLHGIMES